MSKDCLGKGKNKTAAVLSAILLLDFCPAVPEGYLSPASALTIVHERPRQRGSGEFRRLPPVGSGPVSEAYRGDGEVSEVLPDKNVPEADDLSDREETGPENQAELLEKDAQPEKAEELKSVGSAGRKERQLQKRKREPESSLAVILARAAEEAEKPLESSNGLLRGMPGKKTGTAAKPREMTLWPMKTQDVGGTLLLSDNPEYVKETGIYYREQVKGDARVLYYHVNETRKDLRIAIVLENQGETHAIVHVNRLGLAEPSPDYLAVGKAVQLSYFGRQSAGGFILAPGERRILCREQEGQLIKPKDLACSCVDFTVSRPVMATVLVHEADDSPLEYIEEAPLVKAVGRTDTLRGSYTGMNRLLTGKRQYRPRRDGIVYFTIGDGDADKFHSGIDSADGTIMTNEGNYGIVYNITIPCARGGFRVYLAPRGGVYAGAVNVEADEGAGSPRLIETPGWSGWNFGTAGLLEESHEDKTGKCLISPQDEVTLLGSFQPRHELRLEMSPPPGSNLPVRIILVPEGMEPLAPEAKKG